MAEFVSTEKSPQSLEFNNFKLELIWTIEDTNEKKNNQSSLGHLMGSGNVSKWTDDDINNFIEKATALEEEKDSLEANLD